MQFWILVGVTVTTLLIVLALGLVAGVAAYATGTFGRLGQAPPDREPADLPDDRTLLRGDVDRVRFAVGLRGYRMDQVDSVLDRLASELDERDEYIGTLTGALNAAGAEVPKRPERVALEAAAEEPEVEATQQADEAADSDDAVQNSERADA